MWIVVVIAIAAYVSLLWRLSAEMQSQPRWTVEREGNMCFYFNRRGVLVDVEPCQ